MIHIYTDIYSAFSDNARIIFWNYVCDKTLSEGWPTRPTTVERIFQDMGRICTLHNFLFHVNTICNIVIKMIELFFNKIAFCLNIRRPFLKGGGDYFKLGNPL